MSFSYAELYLLKKLAASLFDCDVGDSIETFGWSIAWKTIKNGMPTIFKWDPKKCLVIEQ